MEVFWRKTQQYTLVNATIDKWYNCVRQNYNLLFNITTVQSFLQFTVMNIVKQVSKLIVKRADSHECVVDVKLSDEEQKIVQYVGGFII